MKTWHLICILAGITGVGVIFIMIKTIAQAIVETAFIQDSERQKGTTVQVIHYYSLKTQLMRYRDTYAYLNVRSIIIYLHCCLYVCTIFPIQSSGVLETYTVWQCYELGSIPFIFDLIIFIYLGLLQFVGIILAFQTRKVRINVLNDSKSVTALIYISSIVLVVIVMITFILRGYINISAGLFYGGIILLATMFLGLIFIPKVCHIQHNLTLRV